MSQPNSEQRTYILTNDECLNVQTPYGTVMLFIEKNEIHMITGLEPEVEDVFIPDMIVEYALKPRKTKSLPIALPPIFLGKKP